MTAFGLRSLFTEAQETFSCHMAHKQPSRSTPASSRSTATPSDIRLQELRKSADDVHSQDSYGNLMSFVALMRHSIVVS